MKKQNQCIHCFKTFTSTSSLCRHNRLVHHIQPKEYFQNFECTFCQKILHAPSSLQRHIKTFHSFVPDTSPTDSKLQCTYFYDSRINPEISLALHSYALPSSLIPSTTSYSCTLTASQTSYTTLPALPNPSTSFPSSPIPTTDFHSYALPATSIPTTSFHSYALPASPIPTTSFHLDALPASPIHMTTANSNTVSFIRQPSSPLLFQSSRSLTFFPVTPTRPRPQDNASLYSEHFTGSPRVLRITCPIEDCGNAYTRYSALQKHTECHHHINIEHKDKLFSSINDFYSWKSEIEQNRIV
ncbi:uncharacterized protein LOC113382050 [Ctenocephalides felis]|uniref:uncharacterized protein LOC113381914 n=1 Tax=Ctenocephalides felis TaxID=7515 RepID=UPI000E6E128A|nr:uncharacterized protein LOC113381914 [Ctenocephalides felis]XP_026476396.1 uncharacterized protein LOC113382050 [Ctenocephalides felis]